MVLDASWTDGRWRAAAAELARRTQSELVTFCCQADDDVAIRRIEERRAAASDVSEATPDVREALRRVANPWHPTASIDSSNGTPEEVVATALGILSRLEEGTE